MIKQKTVITVFVIGFIAWILWHLLSAKAVFIAFLDEERWISEDYLIRQLDDKSEAVRIVVISRLVDKGLPVVPKLLEALEFSSSRDVREGVATALARIAARNPDSLPKLAEGTCSTLARSLDDQDNAVRVQAAIALYRITREAKTVLPTLLAVWRNGSKTEKHSAAEGLCELGTQASSAYDDISVDLDDPDPNIRELAANVLQAIKLD